MFCLPPYCYCWPSKKKTLGTAEAANHPWGSASGSKIDWCWQRWCFHWLQAADPTPHRRHTRGVFEYIFGAQACFIPPACISRIDVTCLAALGYRRENPFAESLRPTCTRNIIDAWIAWTRAACNFDTKSPNRISGNHILKALCSFAQFLCFWIHLAFLSSCLGSNPSSKFQNVDKCVEAGCDSILPRNFRKLRHLRLRRFFMSFWTAGWSSGRSKSFLAR